MKKITAIVLLSALLLTACTNSETPESSDTQSSSTSSTDSDNFSTTSSSSSTTPNNSNSENSQDGITAPDGSILSESEAIYANDVFLGYDFSYIRYAQPIFHNTLDEPDLVDWDTLKFSVKEFADIENPNYFKVKTGDKLENGLTVKSAEYRVIRSNSETQYSTIELEGEITLEGILHCHSEDGYNVYTGQLDFWADTTKYDYIPLTCDAYNKTAASVFPEDEFAIVCDGYRIFVGSIDSTSIDLSGIISPGKCIRAQVTISDWYQEWYDGGNLSSRATLVSVDKIR